MGKGGGAPPPPDYTPAHLQDATAREQLQWAKDQYAEQAPYTKQFMDTTNASMKQQMDAATADRARYEKTYQPIEDQFNRTATGWNAPARAEQQSAQAQADVANQFEQARQSATANLESFGIDPSQTRFGALDLGTRVSQAAAMAGAGTQSRINTEATGLGLMGEAINVGKGYPGQVAQAYSGSTQAGSAGVTGGLSQSSTYGNMMGTGTQWAGVANQSRGVAGGALKSLGDYQLGASGQQQAANAATGQGIGTAVGAVAGLATVGIAV
jgi:hypothetical protein